VRKTYGGLTGVRPYEPGLGRSSPATKRPYAMLDLTRFWRDRGDGLAGQAGLDQRRWGDCDWRRVRDATIFWH
jgi:hypothetical protein